ncbi:MAG: PAS domain S-box protein [Syntrophaceae bacterium]
MNTIQHSFIISADRSRTVRLVTALKLSGRNVKAFRSAEEALSVLNPDIPPELIITDLMLPQMDGLKLCRLLRSKSYRAFHHTPILVIAAMVNGEHTARTLSALGAACLTEPITPDDLKAMIEALLEGRYAKKPPLALVITEDRGLQTGLRRAFKAQGYTLCCDTGKGKTLSLLRKKDPEVIILDDTLADIKRAWFLDEINRLKPLAAVVILRDVSTCTNDTRLFAKGAGAVADKPCDAEALVEVCLQARRERTLFDLELRRHEHQRQLSQSEDALRLAYQEWQDIFQSIGHPAMIIDLERHILAANRTSCAIMGSPEDDLIGRRCHKVFHNSETPPQTCPLQEMLATGRMSICEMPVEALGKVFLVSCAPILDEGGNIERVLHFATDITERKRAEEALKESEARFQTAFVMAPIGMALVGINGHFLSVNQAFCEMLGYSAEELNGMTFEQITYPEDLSRNREMVRSQLASPAKVHHLEKRYIAKDGRMVWASVNSLLIRSANGQPLHFIMHIQDITEHKRAEFLLHQERSRAQKYLDIASVIMIALNIRGEIEMINRKGCQILGYDESELIGQEWFATCLPREVGPKVKKAFLRIITGELSSAEYLENLVVTRSGEERLIAWHNSIVRDDSGVIIGTLSSGEDITDSRKAEVERQMLHEQLGLSQKMESVGRLAGGVAHDFNNLLTPILGYSEIVLSSLPSGDPRMEHVRQILMAAGRAKDLTRQLLAFSHKQVLELKTVDLGKTILHFQKLLKRTIRENISISVRIAPTLGMVSADVGQIEQVIMNLAVNAQDAMPKGGTLTISLSDLDLEENAAAAHAGIDPGPYVLLAVSDSGLGMERETLSRLFEPFFTTKTQGHGTGLGLSIVHSIIQQHDGAIRVESEPDQGTTFKIYLPRLKDIAPQTYPDIVPAGEYKRGTETVLVVDDNQAVRDLVNHILGNQGYTVIVAESPESCFDIIDQQYGRINLLITDVIMPVMDGRQLFERLHSVLPSLKVLYMSSYAGDVIAHHGIAPELVHFIQKPFSFRALTEKVREALDTPAPAAAVDLPAKTARRR